MSGEILPLTPGLYFVATPIGSARDITLRALDVLAAADVIAAEDTRTARKLMDIHGIALRDRKILAYHDHNGAAMRPRLLTALENGKSVAYMSEAGTPMIADPGFVLAREAIAAGFAVTSAPGPSAVIAALTIAGLPTDRFLFAGFAPSSKGARRRFFAELAEAPATLVIYESPKRIHKSLDDMLLEFGADRQIALCRELTKKFEEVLRGSVQEICGLLESRNIKGEIVVVVDRNRAKASDDDLETELEKALQIMTVKDAATAISEKLGLPRRQVYQAALKLGNST